MKYNRAYPEFEVGDILVLVSNDDYDKDNGRIVEVCYFNDEKHAYPGNMNVRNYMTSEASGGNYRVTKFRKITKLEKALK